MEASQTCVAESFTANMSKTKKSGLGEITKEMVVTNKLGIHARPAAMFVKKASQFRSEILVEKDGETVNGKSIMGMMMLAAGYGSRLHVHASGEDAAEAIQTLEALLKRKFDEE